jgi:hypothetical protein
VQILCQLYFAGLGSIVRRRVKKFGPSRIRDGSGADLGDIDILVLDRRRKHLLALETKRLEIARTPAELAHQLEGIFRGSGGRPAAVERHLRRTAWLRQHMRQVLESFEFDPRDHTRWKVEPLLVLDHQAFTPYLVNVGVKVITYRELSERGFA